MFPAKPQRDTTAPSLGFVATKPIQIIASIILSRQLAKRSSSLCVVPTFADGVAVAGRLAAHVDSFTSVFTVADRIRAVFAQTSRRHDVVFLDSDVGARTTLAMRLAHTMRPRLRFAVYEEGASLFEPLPQERPRRVLEWLGATPTLGEGVLTSEVWSYTPERLRARLPKQRIMRIEQAPVEFIEQERDLVAAVFWPTYELDTRHWGGTRCLLFLSSWQVDERGIAYLRHTTDFTVFKPHPHIRDPTVAGRIVADQVLRATIPAELVVLTLARTFEEVTVLHDDSTTARYVTLPNVRFVRLAELGDVPQL